MGLRCSTSRLITQGECHIELNTLEENGYHSIDIESREAFRYQTCYQLDLNVTTNLTPICTYSIIGIMVLARSFDNATDIYLRLCPVIGGTAAQYELNHEEGTVEWLMPREAISGMTNHQPEKYSFSFTGILDTDAKQDTVFDTVAEKVVVGALDGYNGTIFAYGQTGSGKTYTITGNAERYVDRGIIPRAVSLIFSELTKRTDCTYQLHFAYLEIYNEICYDLLNPEHETKALDDLPKVTMLEDGDNCFHLRNLSQHLATNEEEALNLLFVGETNRIISATPMNMASSRSHCIFTITIESRKGGEDTVMKSKLHIVDLAGSERVWKKGIDGQVLREAKFINLSLHFLEQVIIALQERSQGKPRHHIPYRNSMMTSVLRDSIGGNSLTVMVATVTTAQQQLEETISTCRFAQRVALVSNHVTLNEEIDPNLLIRRLKQEIRDLKEELQLLRGDQEKGPLTANELHNLQNQIKNYVADALPDAPLNCGGTMVQIRAAFQIFKEIINMKEDNGLTVKEVEIDGLSDTAKGTESMSKLSLQETISNLTHELQEREDQINTLVSFIKKQGEGVVTASASVQVPEEMVYKTSFMTVQNVNPSAVHKGEPQESLKLEHVHDHALRSFPMSENQQTPGTMRCLEDRLEAFEIFRSGYPRWNVIEENKVILKTKYAEAKVLGEKVNKARGVINETRAIIEKRRVDKAIQSLVQGADSSDCADDPEEEHLISIIEIHKIEYKENFGTLRDLKKEIEHLHLLLEQSQMRLQGDFEKWVEPFVKITSNPPLLHANSTMRLGHQESSLEGSRSSQHYQTSMEPQLSVVSPRPPSTNIRPLSATPTNIGFSTISNDNKEVPKVKDSSLTGDASMDANIFAFYKARADILSMKSSSQCSHPSAVAR